MRYILKINEAVGNIQLLRFYVKKMLLEIFKIYKITGNNLHKHVDRTYNYKLDINNIPDEKLLVSKIEKIIIKYKKVFLRNNMILSYYKGVYSGYDDDDNNRTYYANFSIYVKNLFTNRVKSNKFIYHFSPSENRDSILENGILPKSSKESVKWSKEAELEYPPLIFAVNGDPEDGGWYHVSKVDVWQIDTTKINNIWWRDLNNKYLRSDLIMSDKHIPVYAIKLVNSLTLK